MVKVTRSARAGLLIVGVFAATALLVVPTWIAAPAQQPTAAVIVEALACGIVIGIGRQGIDVLVIRVLATALALELGWVLGGHVQGHTTVCTGIFDCQQLGLGLMFGLILIAPVLALVAVPTTLIWSRDISALKPEIPWRRIPRPRTWWQWVLFVLALITLLYFSPGLLGLRAD